MYKVVISGVTSGFGIEWLYQMDSLDKIEFFVLARSRAKFDALISARPLSNIVHFIECNYNSLSSVDMAYNEIKGFTDSIDIFINNAGLWAGNSLEESEDGIELTLAVNHLAPFVLTGKLLPLLEAAPSARIVNTASFTHKSAKLDKSDIEMRNNYDAEQAYYNSKLYTILFTRKLAEQLSGTTISVNCFDPGIVDTAMLSENFPKSLAFMYPFFRRFVARTPKKGADTGVYLSVSSGCDDITGMYFKDRKVKKPSKHARDNSIADWLWRESERLTGFSFPKTSGGAK